MARDACADRNGEFPTTGYVYAEASGGSPEVTIIATGSEVQFAVEARESLETDGVPTRVVSMPCVEWFRQQPTAYQQSVIPSGSAKVAVEAGLTMGWREFVGDRGKIVGIDHFGASADYKTLYENFGITTAAVIEAARAAIGGK
ncbi:MAG: hypothetical protein EBY42_04560 [Actinobacteria bacterium]|nr:hypothetical protein [Actinomycetota bacterium]